MDLPEDEMYQTHPDLKRTIELFDDFGIIYRRDGLVDGKTMISVEFSKDVVTSFEFDKIGRFISWRLKIYQY